MHDLNPSKLIFYLGQRILFKRYFKILKIFFGIDYSRKLNVKKNYDDLKSILKIFCASDGKFFLSTLLSSVEKKMELFPSLKKYF
jgi:hypothetical protein